MNLHEYQGKEILKRYGVAVQSGIVANTVEEAEAAWKELGSGVVVNGNFVCLLSLQLLLV